ncbi:hypothetical protein V6N13_043155 [Hibiscus sabdariffa]
MMVNMKPRVDCIIADGGLGIAVDVAEEVGIPVIQFRAISACCIWAFYAVPNMIQAGELPIKGMETFLRCRDLPSFCRVMDSTLQRTAKDARKNFHGHGLVLNTFEDLEGDTLSHMRTKSPNIYTVGPLHLHLRTRLFDSNRTLFNQSSNNVHEVDRSCLSWLDKQPKGSVVYVSFGSIAVLSSEQVFEFWFGLVNSGKRFLWVLRPGIMPEKGDEGNNIPVELIKGTKERGCIVSWAPQEEVLGHGAIGGFLTHSGSNSTLESVVEGVPMICWPYFADQQINSRFVSQVWGLGLDMKDLCDRHIVEKMVNDLMVERRDEFLKSATKMAKLAGQCVNVGGSSYCNLDRLVEDIKSMNISLGK